MTREFFLQKSKNIGSLIIFLSNKRNYEYLNYLNERVPEEIINKPIAEKVYYYLNGIKQQLLCICGEHLKFIGFKNGYRKTCGKKDCFVASRRNTCLEIYGVDNPKKSVIIKEKEKQSILTKWNGRHYLYDDSVRSKFKSTMLSKWGCEWAQQNSEIRGKAIETWYSNPEKDIITFTRSQNFKNKSLEEKNIIELKKKQSIILKFGSWENFIKYRLEKIRLASVEKWNSEHHFNADEVVQSRSNTYKRNKIKKIISLLPQSIDYISVKPNTNYTDSYIILSCKKCNNEFEITRQLFYLRCKEKDELCSICNPSEHGVSKMELELLDFLKENYSGEILHKYSGFSKEIDIYLPDIKLAFEFNGLYWHSKLYKDRFYHLEKTLDCSNQQIQLIHIWEDDWVFKNDIIKSQILHKIHKTSRIIFARKCLLVELNDSNVKSFLEENDLKAWKQSSRYFGLTYEGEIVAVMSFDSLGENIFEVSRFCIIKSTAVVGACSRLIKTFLKKFPNSEIIVRSDFSNSCGDLWEKIGFTFNDFLLPIVQTRYNGKSFELYDCGYQIWKFH